MLIEREYDIISSYPKTVVVRDGARVVLRPMVAADRDKLLEFFRGVPEEDRWYFKEDPTQEGVIDGWVRNLNYERVLPIVAETDGRIVADATLHRRPWGTLHATGKVRIVVAPDFRRKGLGMWMLLDLVNIAMHARLDKLVAELVVEKENPAIEAFKRLGFITEATMSDMAKGPDGRPYDVVYMVKTFYPDWGDY